MDTISRASSARWSCAHGVPLSMPLRRGEETRAIVRSRYWSRPAAVEDAAGTHGVLHRCCGVPVSRLPCRDDSHQVGLLRWPACAPQRTTRHLVQADRPKIGSTPFLLRYSLSGRPEDARSGIAETMCATPTRRLVFCFAPSLLPARMQRVLGFSRHQGLWCPTNEPHGK